GFRNNKLSAELAVHATKRTAESIWDRIRLMKEKGNDAETIGKMEDIINELITEKSDIVKISQSFEEELSMRKISDDDVNYITDKIILLIEKLLVESEAVDQEKLKENMEVIKHILSKDTFNILQLLGFNFKQAIGEPLTHLVKDAITSQSPVQSDKTLDYKIANENRLKEHMKVLQNDEAYTRLMNN